MFFCTVHFLIPNNCTISSNDVLNSMHHEYVLFSFCEDGKGVNDSFLSLSQSPLPQLLECLPVLPFQKLTAWNVFIRSFSTFCLPPDDKKTPTKVQISLYNDQCPQAFRLGRLFCFHLLLLCLATNLHIQIEFRNNLYQRHFWNSHSCFREDIHNCKNLNTYNCLYFRFPTCYDVSRLHSNGLTDHL